MICHSFFLLFAPLRKAFSALLMTEMQRLESMLTILNPLREFTFLSICLRLLLATLAGGVIGYGRSKKKRAAGLRTYMLTSMGAALTLLLALFDYNMLEGGWAEAVKAVGSMKLDVSRYSSQVIAGIGFLSAGSILAAAHQQVSGLTTAIGLVGSVCIGLACGAGFYELVLVSVFLLVFSMEMLGPVEMTFKRRRRNITVYVEFDRIEDVSKISEAIIAHNAQIFDIDIEQTKKKGASLPGAIFDVKMSRENASHSEMLSVIAELPCVRSIQELIQ